MAKWIEITKDFDRTIPFTKVRWDISKSAAWATVGSTTANGYFSEVPGINADGLNWSNITSASYGYAGLYRFALRAPEGTRNGYVFSCRAENFTDRSMLTYGTQITENVYEYTYPITLYWGGIGVLENPYTSQEGTGIYVFAEASSLEVDTEEIAATSGSSSFTVNITADTEVTWTASTTSDWIGLSPSTGTGSGSFTVSIPDNPEYSSRSGEITIVSSDEGEASIAVSQAKKAVILTRRDIYRSGNQVNKAYRSGNLIYLNIYKPAVPPTPPGPDYSVPFTLESQAGGNTFTISGTSDAYSQLSGVIKHNDSTEETVYPSQGTITLNSGETLSLKTAQILPLTDVNITSTGNFKAYGNIMSLVDTGYDDTELAITDLTQVGEKAFYSLFSGATTLTDASGLLLPAATLANGCYQNMFKGCTNLTQAPSTLPSTTLAERCYQNMFRDCASITTAPELPATTLTKYCYGGMFYGCTNLTQGPTILPATTLQTYCYWAMFANCSSLNYIKCLATSITVFGGTMAWVDGVAATGTFVKAAGMTGWTTGADGIPEGWTVEEE